MNDWKPSEYIDLFLKEQDVVAETKIQYRRTLEQFFRWIYLQSLQSSKLSRTHAIAYRNNLINIGRSGTTINFHFSLLRCFFRWMDLNNYHEDITRGIRNLKLVRDYIAKSLTKDQVKQLIESIRPSMIDITSKDSSGKHEFISNDKPVNWRNYVIVNLMLYTGLRTIEVVRINYNDITEKNGKRMLNIQGKGRKFKDIRIPLVDAAWSPIQKYIEIADINDGPLFISFSNRSMGKRISVRTIGWIVTNCFNNAGFSDDGFTAHSLRHTAAVSALKAGATLEQVQKMMRHSNSNTTMIYMRSIGEEIRMENHAGKLLEKYFK